MEKIKLQENQDNINGVIKTCLDFLSSNGGENISVGRHNIIDSDIYANVSEYTTCLLEDCKWEAHKEYADFQIMLDGKENIGVSDIAKMAIGEYHSESDYLECTGDSDQVISINKTLGVLLMPEDAHMPGICAQNQPSKVKKCVFKIPVSYF